MRMPKRGQKGFTLIELLIVVAILGVLAAVVIPNVGRFLGRGEDEARRTEKKSVESAIIALMAENNLSEIPNPKNYAGGVASKDMTAFPDATSVCASADKLLDPDGDAYTAAADANGYVLYNHDKTADAAALVLHNYTTMSSTGHYYTCEVDGTVRQWDGTDTSTATEYTD